MELKGYLSEFSLPEIFQFLEQGQKKGLLSIRALAAAHHKVQSYYIWLLQGRIVAAADRLDGQGLLSMIEQRGFVNADDAANLTQICRSNTPLGLCLKSEGLLQADQLTLLFRTQVLKQVSAVLQIENGQFEFDPTASLPQAEITGLSMPATEVTLLSLRTLQNWTALAEKLPEPTVGLLKPIQAQPQLRLDSSELQVWELANAKVSLQQMAKKLGFSVEKVQQIAFRLIVTNLVEEIFLIEAAAGSAVAETPVLKENLPSPIAESSSTSKVSNSLTTAANAFAGNNLPSPIAESSSKFKASNSLATQNPPKGNNSAKPVVEASNKAAVSQSFLHNLVGFLKGKV